MLVKLRDLRKEEGFTQKQMAKNIDMSLSMYQKVESGKVLATGSFIRRIKKKFPSINIDEIFF